VSEQLTQEQLEKSIISIQESQIGLLEEDNRRLREKLLRPPTDPPEDPNWTTNLKDLLSKDPPPFKWLINDLWPDQACGFLAGAPKGGKSFVAFDMALSIMTGTKCLGHFQVKDPGPVIYIAEEGSVNEITRRLMQMAVGKKLEASKIQDFHIAIHKQVMIDDTKWQKRIDDLCAKVQPKAIFFDTFIRVHGADENKSSDIRNVLKIFRKIQIDWECAVILLHHKSKPKDEAKEVKGGHLMRGSSDMYAWFDSAVYLRSVDGKGFPTTVSVEHRDSSGMDEFTLELEEGEDYLLLKHREGGAESARVRGWVDKVVAKVNESGVKPSVHIG